MENELYHTYVTSPVHDRQIIMKNNLIPNRRFFFIRIVFTMQNMKKEGPARLVEAK